jgi:hypothetical protein
MMYAYLNCRLHHACVVRMLSDLAVVLLLALNTQVEHRIQASTVVHLLLRLVLVAACKLYAFVLSNQYIHTA